MQNNSLQRKHASPAPKIQAIDAKGILELRALPDEAFGAYWKNIVLPFRASVTRCWAKPS